MNPPPSCRSVEHTARWRSAMIAVLLATGLWSARLAEPRPDSFPANPALSQAAPSANSPAQTLTGEAAKAELEQRGLSASLNEAYAAARLAAHKIDPADPRSRGAAYFATNSQQNLQAWFGREGIEMASTAEPGENEEPWSVCVRLVEAGRARALAEPEAPNVTAAGARVELGGPSRLVTEWYENRGDGIEQGFTFAAAPGGKAGLLELVLQVAGTVHAEALANAGDGGGAQFVGADGKSVMSYRSVQAWDATGRRLPARIEVRGTNELVLLADDAGAQYPVTIDPLFASTQARLSEELLAGDMLGTSVALSADGNTALLGAPSHRTINGAKSGSAYVFVRNGTVWTQQAELAASDGAAGDNFGNAAALSSDGNLALIGAPNHTTAIAANAGSAYVFVRDGTHWSQEAELSASDGLAGDNFGYSAALSGDGSTAVLGAPSEISAMNPDEPGIAYVFVRSGTQWTQQIVFFDLNGANGDNYGQAVALSANGNIALVGSPFHDDGKSGPFALGSSGSAFVYVRIGTQWFRAAELEPKDTHGLDYFGDAVALSADGDTALIGASAHLRGVRMTGAAYIFERSGTHWTQRAELLAAHPQEMEDFGNAVSLSSDGKTALVAADSHSVTNVPYTGSVSVFSRAGAGWHQQAELLLSQPDGFDGFGSAVAASSDGRTVLVGVAFLSTFAASSEGSASVFTRHGMRWPLQAELFARGGEGDDSFGTALALSADGTTALIGVPGVRNLTGPRAGSAYVFVRSGPLWVQQAELTDELSESGDHFGQSVALSLDGNTALIGAPNHGPPDALYVGSTYVFVRTGTIWARQAALQASDGVTQDNFGIAVALSGDGTRALVGAHPDFPFASTHTQESYVFARSGTLWTEEAKLTQGDGSTKDDFGAAVALNTDGSTALIGAPSHDLPSATDAGSAYIFVRSGTQWSLQVEVMPGDSAASDKFGTSVGLSGDGNTALVGAPFHDATDTDAGSAYVFVRAGTSWSQQAELNADDGAADDQFGTAVALRADGGEALIGAINHRAPNGARAGGVDVFVRTGAVWTPGPELNSGIAAFSEDVFGSAVALVGTTALVGAPNANSAAGLAAGTATAFEIGQFPEIDAQPQSQTVVPGQSVTFSVTASGYAPLKFQWRKDGAAIAGATGPSFTIPSAQSADRGNYDVVVSNLGGVVTSAAAMLGVNDLSLFSQIQPGAPPEARGFLTVNLSPEGILTGWRLAGEQQWRSSGIPASGLATGDRMIEYRPVPGYTQPADELVSVVSGTAATVVDRSYSQIAGAPTGNVVVTLVPQTIASPNRPVDQRAQWRFLGEDDTSWRDSGTEVDGLPVGVYLIESKPVPQESTPVPAAVLVQDGQTAPLLITCYLADAPVGTQPSLVSFSTATSSPSLPYSYLGQLRSDVGEGTGFVVKTRVVVTAGHVVFDDGALSAATNLQWLFQRDSASYEPAPQIPRGSLLLSGYAEARAAEGTPGVSAPASQTLDAAVLYFLEGAGRGGSGGFLASDSDDNEWLLSPRLKILAGYPVNGVPAAQQGEIFATAPLDIAFTQAFQRTYVTQDITSVGGMSGAPLSVQYDDGIYYPAAIYLGGTAETVVRALDSDVVQLITQANTSANAGENNVGGGITQTSVSALADAFAPGSIHVIIAPPAAVAAGAQWAIKSVQSSTLSPFQDSGATLSNLSAGDYLLQFSSATGFQSAETNTVTIANGKQLNITFTYAPRAPVVSSAASRMGSNGQPFSYQIAASSSPTSYAVVGTLPMGLGLDATSGLISGTPLASGKFTVTVKASNGAGIGTKAVDLIVLPAPADQVASVSFGQPLRYPFASGETSATYAALQALPDGLSLDSSTGIVSGTPRISGIFTVTISVTVNGASATAMLTLKIGPQLDRNGKASLSGEIGAPFDSTPLSSAAAGVTYTADHLPPGLMINQMTGEITGMPMASGVFDQATITGTNADGATATMLTITINSILTVPAPTGGKVYEIVNGKLSQTPVALTSTRLPGETVTLQGGAARGYFFAGWTGLGTTVFTPQVSFAQADGLSVTAHFRAFSECQGIYTGLTQQMPPHHETSGAVAVALGAAGSFTGSLHYAGFAYPLRGKFAPNAATAAFTFQRPTPLSALKATLRLDALAAISVAVNLDDGSVQSTISTERAAAYSKAHPAPATLPGKYTALLTAISVNGGPAVPAGDGPATVFVKPSGAVFVAGFLPDDSPVSAAGQTLPDGRVVLYAPLLNGAGSFLGILTLVPNSTADGKGSLRWYRPQIASDLNFPDGWPDGIDATMEADHYAAPRAPKGSQPALPLFPILPTGGTASLTLVGGGLGAQLLRSVTISSAGKLTVTPPAGDLENITLSLVPATGLLKGSFLDQSTSTSRALKGAVLQKSNRAGGYFLAPGGGSLKLVP